MNHLSSDEHRTVSPPRQHEGMFKFANNKINLTWQVPAAVLLPSTRQHVTIRSDFLQKIFELTVFKMFRRIKFAVKVTVSATPSIASETILKGSAS